MKWSGVIGGEPAYRLLKLLNPDGDETGSYCSGSSYAERSKLEHLFGPDIWSRIAGKTVIDFGCGAGLEAVELAQRGARQVIGLDISEKALANARSHAREAGVSNIGFAASTAERADLIISLDAFEHYDDPEAILRYMKTLLKPGGQILACFGPPWLHPFGGHLFSIFPWSHLIFTEKAQLRWRSDFKTDGATRFQEVEGGLNQMTIRRFRDLVARCGFRFEHLELVPMRTLRRIHCRLTNEFTTALVRCRLTPDAYALPEAGRGAEHL